MHKIFGISAELLTERRLCFKIKDRGNSVAEAKCAAFAKFRFSEIKAEVDYELQE